MVELWCNYEHFKAVEPKIEHICRGVESLNCAQIKVKPSDIVKARQFVSNKYDNDKTVLCVYREKDKILDIFAKKEEYITPAVSEFNNDPLKMTGRGPKDPTPTAIKATVKQTEASSYTQQRATVTEPKNKHVSSFIETNTPMSSSMSVKKQCLVDSKDSSLTRSQRNTNMINSQQSALGDISTKYSDQSPKNVAKSNIKSTVSSKQYSQGLHINSGSNFLYEFTLSDLKVFVYPHSIVDVKNVDVIVNAANDIMVHGGGIAYYISKAAGKQMDDEGRAYVSKYGKLRVVECCVTGAGRLPYKGIIHAVGPQWADYIGIEDHYAEDLYKTIRNTLRAAKEKTFQRIALCDISAG